ncbi:hypothetical protein Pfo_027035 [Paulownia fortunei]|nr:hypothetical protein Pfo_027035 [Paulownia fortunei]
MLICIWDQMRQAFKPKLLFLQFLGIEVLFVHPSRRTIPEPPSPPPPPCRRHLAATAPSESAQQHPSTLTAICHCLRKVQMSAYANDIT